MSKDVKQKAQSALYTLVLLLGMVPFALVYIASVVGLWRFIGWCLLAW